MKPSFFSIIIFTAFVCLPFLPGTASAIEIDEKVVPVLTLEQAMKMALTENPDSKNISERIIQARTSIGKTWAQLVPKLYADATITRNDEKVSMDLPDFGSPDFVAALQGQAAMPMTEQIIQDEWENNYGFTVNMIIFNPRSFMYIANSYDNLDYSKLSGKHLKNELLFVVSSAYYQVHSARELIGAAKKNLGNAESFHEAANAKFKIGTSTKLDLLRAESELINSRKLLENANDSYALAKSALSALIDTQEDFITMKPERLEVIPGNPEELLTNAYSKRLDLQASKVSHAISNRNVHETWVRWMPNLDVTYNWSNSSVEDYNGENESWRVIFGAKWSLFDGGARFADLRNKKSLKRQAANTLRKTQLDIRYEIEKAQLQLSEQARNVKFAISQETVAEESFAIATEQYIQGIASSLDVISASNFLSRSRTDRVLTELQYNLAMLNLKKALGNYHSLL